MREPKKVVRLNEKDLTNLIKRVINEQNNLTPDPNAVKATDELMKNIKSGFCIPVYQEGSRTRIDCKDKKYYEIRHYRRFGQ